MPNYTSCERATSLMEWAVNNFKSWKAMCEAVEEEKFPDDLL